MYFFIFSYLSPLQPKDLPNYHQIGSFHFYINPEMNSDDFRQAFLNNPDKPSTEGGGHDEL